MPEYDDPEIFPVLPYEAISKEIQEGRDAQIKIAENNRNFFNFDNTFSKMKKTGLFMTMGRGAYINESGLTKALKEETIGGVIMDTCK
jgi:lactate dehydrogenase-like 2-hydroxyacid dehydrogenase